MTHSRFYAPALEAGDAAVTLPIDEGRHLTRVMRLRAGAPVRVFNGRGLECVGHVAAVERDDVTIAIEAPVDDVLPEPAARITLAQSVLKGDCMDGVVRDAVMLGAAAIVPLLTARVEGDRRSHAAGLRVSRWERIAVASAKQCGRAVVPPIAAATSLSAALSAATGLRVALVEPAPNITASHLRDLAAVGAPPSATLFIGPEGGWAEEELRLLAGYEARAITLGQRTLRAESAAIVGLSVLHTLWREFV